MKRIVTLLLAVLMLAALIPASLAEEGYKSDEEIMGIDPAEWPKTMYVRTAKGGNLNVRSEPITGSNVIGQLEFGAKVTVLSPVIVNTDWSAIQYKGGTGYVYTRYLSTTKPSKKEQEERQANAAELSHQKSTFREIEKPFTISVRASRPSGWVNFRTGPGVAAERIMSLPDGRELTAIGETEKWYQAIDSRSKKTGYISKNYVNVLGMPIESDEPAKTQMGRLDVNGAFTLQCRLPEGYSMQLVNGKGSKISAMITPTDKEKPTLQLTVAFSEEYYNVKRMNDLHEEDLKLLEGTFTEMDDVEITYTETAYGTKLLVARETGENEDFVDIMSVYEGYFIEFLMTPNSQAADARLTDEQIRMCVDFLSELDFIPAR
ncbi:MAG: SH3 domain-containing protein [Clostridia bacterium]|nr:SH3 domain-containing protein [Clostridia bacterium]